VNTKAPPPRTLRGGGRCPPGWLLAQPCWLGCAHLAGAWRVNRQGWQELVCRADAMATRKSSTTRKGTAASRKRKSSNSSSTRADAPMPGITAAERRKLAQQEAKWRAESDLRTLREAEEIRRDQARLQRAAKVATEEMQALQAVRSLRTTRR